MNSFQKNAVIQMTKNELIKFFSRKVAFFLVAFIFIFVFCFAIYNSSLLVTVQKESWKEDLIYQNQEIENMLNSNDIYMNDTTRVQYLQEYEINQYMIENNIMPPETNSLAGFIMMINKMFAIVIIISIVAAAQIISTEYSDATIDSLLTLPCKRWKILTSKIIALVVICISIVVILYLSCILIGGIFFGFSGLNAQIVSYADGIIVRSVLANSFYLNVYNLVSLIGCASLTFFITLLFKNGIVSTCSGVLLYYLGSQLSYKFSSLSWAKYLLFTNIHFQMYFEGFKLHEGITPLFSVCVVMIHSLAFFAGSFLLFNRRDN